MAGSRLWELTEPAVFIPDVAKQHDEFVRAIAFGVLVSACTSFWLDEITRNSSSATTKICQNQDLLSLLSVLAEVWVENAICAQSCEQCLSKSTTQALQYGTDFADVFNTGFI